MEANFFFCLEVYILNSFCIEKMVRSNEHQQQGRKKRDMLLFRLEQNSSLVASLHDVVVLVVHDLLSIFS